MKTATWLFGPLAAGAGLLGGAAIVFLLVPLVAAAGVLILIAWPFVLAWNIMAALSSYRRRLAAPAAARTAPAAAAPLASASPRARG
jgi:predicted lipid-binding transport protein (Tim44 family)